MRSGGIPASSTPTSASVWLTTSLPDSRDSFGPSAGCSHSLPATGIWASRDYRMRYLDSVLALTAMGRDGYQHALIDSARSIRRLASERGWPLETWTRTKLDFVEGLGSYLVGEHGLAAESLQTYVAEADRKSWLLGPAELILGKIADLRGDRASATDHYRKVRRHENVWNAHQEAERYLSDPFDGQEPGSRPPDPVKRYPRQP